VLQKRRPLDVVKHNARIDNVYYCQDHKYPRCNGVLCAKLKYAERTERVISTKNRFKAWSCEACKKAVGSAMEDAASPVGNTQSSTGVGDAASVPRGACTPAVVSAESSQEKHKHACKFPGCDECQPDQLVRWASRNTQDICLKHAHPACAAGGGAKSEDALSLAFPKKPWYHYLLATEH
jgi:hypothetical protein